MICSPLLLCLHALDRVCVTQPPGASLPGPCWATSAWPIEAGTHEEAASVCTEHPLVLLQSRGWTAHWQP